MRLSRNLYSRVRGPDNRSRSSKIVDLAPIVSAHVILLCVYWLSRKFFLTPSHSAPSFGVTPFEFMKKLYGSWN